MLRRAIWSRVAPAVRATSAVVVRRTLPARDLQSPTGTAGLTPVGRREFPVDRAMEFTRSAVGTSLVRRNLVRVVGSYRVAKMLREKSDTFVFEEEKVR